MLARYVGQGRAEDVIAGRASLAGLHVVREDSINAVDQLVAGRACFEPIHSARNSPCPNREVDIMSTQALC